MTKRSSCSNWINSSFDQWTSVEDDAFTKLPNKVETKNSSKKRIKHIAATTKQHPKQEDSSWAVKYAPITKTELAVHKKKVSEVENWLKNNLNCSLNNKNPGLLLLTGPAGSGKTATVKTLSSDLNFEIQEWSSTPCETTPYNAYIDGIRPRSDTNDITFQSQATIFNNFLLRVNKYPSLFSSKSNRIILIEEFPNIYLKDTALFHGLIKKFHKIAKCPAVFIISDCTSGESLENRLFPKSLQFEVNMTNISFNPIAPTMLIKTLTNICSKVKVEGLTSILPSKSDLENIASCSMGDIRSAINNLQFFGIQKKSTQNKIPSKHRSMHLKNTNNDGSKRDSSLFLFHALGKVLYSKRDCTMKCNDEKLPVHLKHLEKPPLKENPEEIFEKTSTSAENFLLFLHENYLAFATHIDSVADCSTSLSDADVISVEWTSKDVLKNYPPSVATRSMMLYLSSDESSYRWRPLHKPQYFSVLKEKRNLNFCLKNSFKDTRLNLKELETEFVPFLYQIRPSFLNADKFKLIHQIGHMTLKKFPSYHGEALNEKDLVEDSVKNDNYSANITNFSSATEINPLSEDEEIIIEDYD